MYKGNLGQIEFWWLVNLVGQIKKALIVGFHEKTL
jgi:hypothetical protein